MISGELQLEGFQRDSEDFRNWAEWYLDKSNNTTTDGTSVEVIVPPTLDVIDSYPAIWRLEMILESDSSAYMRSNTVYVSTPKWLYTFAVAGSPEYKENIDSYFKIVTGSIEFSSSDIGIGSATGTTTTPNPTSIPVLTSTPTRQPTSTPITQDAFIIPNVVCWSWASVGKNMVGTSQCVCGPVVSSNYATGSKNKPTFLNIGRPYPQDRFTVVIWERNATVSTIAGKLLFE